LSRDLLASDTLAAAPALVGARLVRTDGSDVRVARIVEVEAYLGREDLASHAHHGRTARNAAMFGPPGHAYVYFVYGMYHCLNVVTEPDGAPAAILIRAAEPLDGVETMRRARLEWLEARRKRGRSSAPGISHAAARQRVAELPAHRLAAGPGLVCAALSIGIEHDGVDLFDDLSPLRLVAAPAEERLEIREGPRVGMGSVPEPWHSRPWRFWVAASPAVSRGGGR
jgi:DNA-3-methyladenine glycosylase